MSYTNKTPNYELPQYVADDKPTYLGDMNKAYLDIDTALKNISDKAIASETLSENANTTSATALSTAQTASSVAQSAQTKADSATTVAQNAQSDATTANTTANEAKTLSQTANTNSQTAITNSETAVSTSNTANTNSQQALSLIEELQAILQGDVLFEDTTGNEGGSQSFNLTKSIEGYKTLSIHYRFSLGDYFYESNRRIEAVAGEDFLINDIIAHSSIVAIGRQARYLLSNNTISRQAQSEIRFESGNTLSYNNNPQSIIYITKVIGYKY